METASWKTARVRKYSVFVLTAAVFLVGLRINLLFLWTPAHTRNQLKNRAYALRPICTPVACLLPRVMWFTGVEMVRFEAAESKIPFHFLPLSHRSSQGYFRNKSGVHAERRSRARSKWGTPHIWERQRVHQRCWIRRFQFPACEWGISAAHANHSTRLYSDAKFHATTQLNQANSPSLMEKRASER
jgi:hypothetical protein